jgi:GNAT superfamily N-acetyltransferase
MVHELAEYERAADQCRLTDEQLRTALFSGPRASGASAKEHGPDADVVWTDERSDEGAERGEKGHLPGPALFGHVAELPTGEVVGFALWFLNFSTWEGVHGIYLEDLYVRPTARGLGAGRALLAALAGICQERGYRRLEWWVLHWNPAREFYDAIGARPMDEWIPYRVEGDALSALALLPRLAGKP